MTQEQLNGELERVAKEFPELERLAVRYRLEAGQEMPGGPYDPCWIVAQFVGKDIAASGETFDGAMDQMRCFLEYRKREIQDEQAKMHVSAASV
jgi:hypothetical protein